MEESNKKFCTKCGAPNELSQKFCGSCGASFDTPINPIPAAPVVKKNINVKAVIIAAAAVLVVAGTSIGIAVYNNPSNKLERALGKDNYALVCDIYYQYSSDYKFKEKAETSFEKYSSEIVSRLAEGDISSDLVKEVITGLDGICDFTDVSDQIDKLSLSKEAFAAAEEFKGNEDYVAAIKEYGKIIEEDTENYEISQKNINECKDLYSEKAIADADKFIADSNDLTGYDKALNTLQSAKATGYTNEKVGTKFEEVSTARNTIVCNEALEKAKTAKTALEGYTILSEVKTAEYTAEFETQIAEYIGKAVVEIKDTVSAQTQKKEYESAYKYLNGLSAVLKSEEEVKTLIKDVKDTIVLGKIDEAEKAAAAKDYEKAYNILDAAYKLTNDARLPTKMNSYRISMDSQYLLSVSNYFVKKTYDDFYHYYRVLPTQTTYYQDYSDKYNTRPGLLIYDDGSVFLRISLGFTEDDWIFMNKIIVDCDGQQFSFTVDYGDRDTNVSGGEVTEVWTVIHTTAYSYDSQYKDLTKMMTAMETAKSVKIRFSGSDGHYDYSIPQSEVNNIVVYWKVYNILDKNKDMKKYVIG